ncbi:hypothetical protein EVJ58_g1237 [Rhodofomes roseus]|uniref:Cytochrome P450 n=1 Tax=Rhodofomes roseus TaxID=34475 RepID=A0A4Y9Z226_9APHY|nr:hypothetical protein EVJ58_g1237 [Rhodofomes roseus]
MGVIHHEQRARDSHRTVKYIPGWFPGATFKRIAEDVRQTTLGLQNKLYDLAREQVQQGTANPSFIVDYLTSNRDRTPEDEELYKQVSTQFYAAGSDTTVSALLSFFLMMAQHPEIQRKAQNEVDAVVGNRLTKCSDRKDMPYLEAVLKEVHRWNPVLPLGALSLWLSDSGDKTSTRDIAYLRVLPCLQIAERAVLHDPILYPEPDKVIPERYLGEPNEDLNPDPRDFAFGYGRRYDQRTPCKCHQLNGSRTAAESALDRF